MRYIYRSTFSDGLLGPPPKSGIGGLRRLGTVLGGRKGAKGMERPPSPEKRPRGTRNPLRRGPSSRQDMQTIPSPPISTVHLPSSPPRTGPPPQLDPPSQSNNRVPPEVEQRRRNDQLNGDTIQQAPTGVSTLPKTNGVPKSDDSTAVQEDTIVPPPGPPPGRAPFEEVFRGFSQWHCVLANVLSRSVIPEETMCHRLLWPT